MTDVVPTVADLVVGGAAGRMGSRIIALHRETPGLKLVAALEAPGHRAVGRDAGEAAGVGSLGVPITADAADAIMRERMLVEFSVPDASLEHLRLVARTGARAVIGTTGFSAAQLLAGKDFDVEVIERHHRYKKDAPSGTALHLARLVQEAMGQTGVRHGREGLLGERPRGEIGLHALRVGDNVGEHTVVFSTLGETLELTHRGHSRDSYARGALLAAKFLAGKPAGRYSMDDVLGL